MKKLSIFIVILIVILSTISLLSSAKEDCSLKSIGLSKADDIAEQLFYTGTCHYRNKEYDKSALSWEKLAKLEKVNPEYQELQIDVLNNLGYLMFFGYGVKENKTQAIEYWQKAIILGQIESEYHLCHAYADTDQPTYDRAKAKTHCDKAYLIYKGMDDKTKGQSAIFEDIKMYQSQLKQ